MSVSIFYHLNKSTNQQINESTNQQINESTNQQINESTNQRINESTFRTIQTFQTKEQQSTSCPAIFSGFCVHL